MIIFNREAVLKVCLSPIIGTLWKFQVQAYDCITFKILSNVSESNDVIVLFYCILHQTSLNMLWKGGAMILQASPGLIAPSFKQVQTCMKLVSFMNIWKKLKLAIKLVKSCINLFELVQTQKSIYRAVLDSFWILFFIYSYVLLM